MNIHQRFVNPLDSKNLLERMVLFFKSIRGSQFWASAEMPHNFSSLSG